MRYEKRKNHYGLDIAKFVCAVMIISAHFVSERCSFPRIIDLIFSLYIFAVPFFFTCSAFLFFKKLNSLNGSREQKDYFKSYQKRIWVMYLGWSIIYWLFRVAGYILYGTDVHEVLSAIHGSIVFSTYSTIWFLPAMAFANMVVYALRNINKYVLALIGIVLYIICCLGYSYRGILATMPVLYEAIKQYEYIFISIRGGLFNGVPFTIIGLFIATRKRAQRMSINLILTVVFALLTVIEAFICNSYFKGDGPGTDTMIMLLPTEFFAVSFLIQLNLQKRKIYLYMRKLSIVMFTSQRLFLSAIPGLWAGFMIPFTANGYLGLVMMNVLIILFSFILIKISKSNKTVGYLL